MTGFAISISNKNIFKPFFPYGFMLNLTGSSGHLGFRIYTKNLNIVRDCPMFFILPLGPYV